jgi:hypothetical protein
MPSPVLWGDEATVRERLRDGISDLKLAKRFYHFDYPFSPEGVVDFYRANYGPVSRAFASLDEEGQKKLQSELVDLWSSHNKAEGDRTTVDAEYLEVIATRAQTASRRAEALAGRIEEGANILAAFAEGLSEEEWKTPVTATDLRPVGVIVHHVASMYPIEIGAVRAIASGTAVTDVTWDVVAQINSIHANDNANVTRADAIELLRKNSHEAANAVRSLTDEELDRAAPFSLSFGAPMTAQFVIEDHPMRHAWHHLARIRKAIGR